MYRLLLVIMTAFAPVSTAIADEVELSDPLMRNPQLTFASLLPTAIDEASDNPFNKRPTMVVNEVGEPFQVSFDIMLPDYPAVSASLLVSEDKNFQRLISQIFTIADTGSMLGGAVDKDFPEGFDCIGDVRGTLISCRMGTAGIQFSASDFLGGDSIDYETVKSLFVTLPLETYVELFPTQ